MFPFSSKESELKKIAQKNQCESEIARLLKLSTDCFQSFFPRATISFSKQGSKQKWLSKDVFRLKSSIINRWLSQTLDKAIRVSNGFDVEFEPEELNLPPELGRIILHSVLLILTCGRDLEDADYFFLSDLGLSLGLKPGLIFTMIEQVQYEARKEAFKEIKKHLSDRQREICAILLLKAIRADNRVHPAEIKYFEIVSELLNNDQARLVKIEDDFAHLNSEIPMALADEIAVFIFKYLVEIVMCDQEYDPEESAFIKEVAATFGIEKDRQESIIQPVAAALMVKTDLFAHA